MTDLRESALIAGLLIDGDLYLPQVSEILSPEDIQGGLARQLYEAALRLKGRNLPVEMMAVFVEAGYANTPSEAMDWVQDVRTSHATLDHAKSIKKARIFEEMAPAVEQVSKTGSVEARAEIAACLRRMEEVDRSSVLKTGADIVSEMTDDFLNADEVRKRIVSTGFYRLDDFLDGGIRPGNLFVVGARTSVGKSSLLFRFAESAMSAGKRVLFISAEMLSKELGYRFAASYTRTKLKIVRRLSLEGFKAVKESADIIRNWPIFIDDSGRISMAAIESHINRVAPDVVVIDYLQRFKVDGKSETRASFFSDVANGLKSLALQKRIAIYAASQLSRDVEKQDRKPALSDFKESGGLEEAADVALMLWATNEEMVKPVRTVNGLILKNRNGQLGQCDFSFFAEQTRFEEWSPEAEVLQ